MQADSTAQDGSPATADQATAEEARIAHLRRMPILRDAAPEALRRAAAAATWRRCPPGAMILNLDDPSQDVWFVVEGAVRIQVRTPSGRELILADINAGGLFGEIAAIDGAPRTAGATALVRSLLCAIPAAAFLDCACSTPAACLALLRTATAMLRRQSTRLLERETLPVRLRIYAELLRLSRPRPPRPPQVEAEARVVSPPPRQHVLAARIGARREAVSRELSDLLRRGVIGKERGAIVIHRPDILRQAVEAELEAEAGL